MGIFDKLFGRTDAAEQAVRDFEQRHAGSIFGLELKKAYDLQKVGIQGRPQYPETDIASLFRWSRRNELVYACIEKICQAAQDPEPIIEMRKGDAWERDDAHPLRRLLMKPNPMDDWCSFIGAWMASIHIAGVFYAEIIRSDDKLPVQLWPLNPAYVLPIAGKGKDGGPIIEYEVKVGSQKETLKPDEILVMRNRTVTDKFHGLSPLAVCLGSVDADQAQTDYVRAFFNNSGIPSGILKINNRSLTLGEAEEKRQRWMSRYGRGGRMQQGPAVLDQGADYQQIGSGLDELESDALTWKVESRICAVFQVPPVLAGAYAGLRWQNNRASAREAQTDFWINKMSPLFKSLRSFVQWNLLTRFVDQEKVFAGDIRMAWDMTTVSALQEDVDAIHTRARENVKAGIWTLNEGREATGQDEDPDGDYYIRSMTVSPQSGEQALLIAQRVDQGKPPVEEEVDVLDADEIDDTKTLDEFDVIEQKARALLGTGSEMALLGGPNGAKSNGNGALSQAPSGVSNPANFISTNGHTTKTFDYDGLTLSREPNEVEKKIDLKAIATAATEGGERVKRVLTGLRKNLIEQAVDMLSDADPAKLHAVVLTPNPKTYKDLRKELDGMYKRGRVQVDQEAYKQTGGKSKRSLVASIYQTSLFDGAKAATIEDDDDEALDRLSDVTVSRVVNSVQSTAAGILATLATLGVTGAELRSRIESQMGESSSAYVDSSAGAAANKAMNKGRDAEIEARSDEIDRIQYSALLDVNTCEQCEAADGEEAASVADLPPAPNDQCLGGDKCRCFHVAVWV